MTTDKELNLTPSGMVQSASLTGMTASSSLDPSGGIYTPDRDDEDMYDDVIDTFNDLLETCRDGDYGFRECAEHTKAHEIKTILNQRSEDCRSGATELQSLIVQMGGEADEGGSASAAMHRGWVAVKGTLSGYSDYAMLDECERAEDVALAQYRKALKQTLPAKALTVVERQMQGVQRNHDQIKAMRDSLKASQ